MALTRHHPGGPDRTFLSITLPGSEKNGVYSHDEVDGHPTRREYVDTVIKAKDEPKTIKTKKKIAKEVSWDMGTHTPQSLGVDFGIIIALDLFLLLTIGDFAGSMWVHLLTLGCGAAYFFFLRNNTVGQQAFDLAPQKSDIVKALSLRAPLIGMLLAMLTYFWEFLIPVLNVLFIQQLGWSDAEYIAVTGGCRDCRNRWNYNWRSYC